MKFKRQFGSRGWGTVALGVAATAVAIANPSREGIQTAAGCSGASFQADEWVDLQPSYATETWSRDGFHFWVGIPMGWQEGLPASLDDLPNTQVEVTDDDGEPIAGQLGMYKIRRQSVALTWRADAELLVGSTIHSKLVLGEGHEYPIEQTLTVADAQEPLELPEVHTDSWVTETWTEGAPVRCAFDDGWCSKGIRTDEVSALTWRLGWTLPTKAPWSFELVMTRGRARQALGPYWVGHRNWALGGIGLQLELAAEYCFKVVGTDFSTGTTLSSEETCSAPRPPEEEVFLDLDALLYCYEPPEHEGLRKRWCDHNPTHEQCGGSSSGGSGGSGGGGGSGGSAGTSASTNTGGSAGTSASGGSTAASGGSAGAPEVGEDKDRLSKGGCWCSVPQAAANGHGAFAFAGLVLLGLRRRRAL